MRRFHLIELHEQRWYPPSWRSLVQMVIGHALAHLGTYDGFIEPFRRFLARCRAEAILDLCSGSGEAAIEVWKRLAISGNGPAISGDGPAISGDGPAASSGGRPPTLLLSDLYPNAMNYRRYKEQYPGWVDFVPDAVDALHPPPDSPPVRTVFNSLHHFRPAEAQAILRDAARNSAGIAVFEITRRSWGNLIKTLLFLPVASAYLTAFAIRPFRLKNVFLGIFFPVVPLAVVFDGIVSNLRAYRVEELEEMTRSIAAPGFAWETGEIAVERTGLKATYLFGWRHRGLG